LLFSHLLDCDRADLYLEKDRFLGKEESSFIALVLRRRMQGEPLQYILGKADFMGLKFEINKSALIPRPETEILADTALSYLKTSDLSDAINSKTLLDLGTGSGCIAVTLAKLAPYLHIYASDISPEALSLARRNAQNNKVRVDFIESDLFKSPLFRNLFFDIIISNPPYISSTEIDRLQAEVRREPRIALDGGIDGLFFYRQLITESIPYLRRGGLLLLEIGFNQRGPVKEILYSTSAFELVETVKDYNNIDRVLVARKVS
jgi:release factor glutamine methyltransferase